MKKLRNYAILGVMLICVVSWMVGKFDKPDNAAPEPTAVTLLHGGEPTEIAQISTEIPTEIPPTSTPIPTATPRPIAPPYREIAEKVENMTEAQWKAYLPTLVGNSVISWTGWVDEVNVKLGGGYELWVDMDSPTDLFSLYDVVFDIPDEIALEFEIDQMVVFSGTINRVVELLGSATIYLEDVSLEN